MVTVIELGRVLKSLRQRNVELDGVGRFVVLNVDGGDGILGKCREFLLQDRFKRLDRVVFEFANIPQTNETERRRGRRRAR